MTPSVPIMTLVSERYAQTMVTPEIIDYKYVYMCKVVFTQTKSLIEIRYFKTLARSIKFATSHVYPDHSIRTSVHIYGIPFEETTGCIDQYYINSINN